MSTVEQWVTVSEAAAAIGITESQVRSAAQTHAIHSRTTAHGRLEVLVELLDDEQVAFAKSMAASTGESESPEHAEDQPLDSGDGDAKAQRSQNPYFKMLHSSEEDDELSRYQRMAGASLIVAQKQADEAAEKVAMLRYELNRSRNRANVAAYAACICVCVALLALFGRGRSAPQAAKANEVIKSDRQELVSRPASAAQESEASEFDGRSDSWREIYEELALARRHQAALASEVDAIRSERRRLEVVVEELAEPLRETSTNTAGFGPSADEAFSPTADDVSRPAERKPSRTRRDFGSALTD